MTGKWTTDRRELTDARATRVMPLRDGAAVTYREVLEHWRNDPAFRVFFREMLAECRYAGIRWETPPVTHDTADRRFECVLLDSPDLIVSPDPAAFAEHFDDAGEPGVVAFSNLGGDAQLVVPCPRGPASVYPHLAEFVRQAPMAQVHALWARVGEAMQRRLGDRPVWLSTAGAGVAWLHLRLDDRPKYYAHGPYRAAP